MTEQHPEAEILPASPCTMVIFGASGDLTKRLLMPALYNLASSQLLPENFAVLGGAIDALNTDTFREQLKRGVQETARGEIDSVFWDKAFGQRLHYLPGEFENPETYQRLKVLLAEIDRDQTLFQRADFVEAGWRAITPVLDVWSHQPARKFPNCSAGTWGPGDLRKPTNSCTATAVTGITFSPTGTLKSASDV